jgi:predicted methyltransferase
MGGVTVAATRRGLMAGAMALAACRPRPAANQAAPAASAGKFVGGSPLGEAVAGSWRSAADKARDRYRHPAESLAFWGVEPGQTVVEFWPGAGWYTEILAPFLAASGGKLYAVNIDPGDPPDPVVTQVVEAYRRKLQAKRGLYGEVAFTSFGPASGPVAPAGSADVVLFLRNIHNWMAAGIAEKAFRDALAALKPGGMLGVEEHRAEPGGVQDPLAASGYVQQDYVVQLAKEAGFRLVQTSEINANAKDDHDHPFGVWTLPPTRLSAPRGEPPTPDFDHAPYDAIGESDRMTLRFVKPATPAPPPAA